MAEPPDVHRGWPTGLRTVGLCAVFLVGCGDAGGSGGPAADPPLAGLASGLELLSSLPIPDDFSGSPHATRLLFGENARAYVLDTNAVLAYDDWQQRFVSAQEPFLRCTVGAFSDVTRSIYCGSPDNDAIVVFDADDGHRKFPDKNVVAGFVAGSFDLVAGPSSLYSAKIGVGVERIPLDASGIPDLAATTTILEGAIEALDGDGDTRLVAFDRLLGKLFLLENEVVVGEVPLEGPPVRVRIHGERVFVSLGSEGAAVVDWKTRSVVQHVHPLAVVTAADGEGDLLAVAATNGMYLYDLARSSEVPIGFDPAEYGFLDVRFLEEGLFGLDWRTVRSYRSNVTGHVQRVDAPKGYVISPGAGIRFPVRNEGDVELVAGGARVPPQGVAWIDVAQGQGDETIELEGVQARRRVLIMRRPDRAVLGKPIPLTDPSAMQGLRIVFVQPDCALQFPAWKDAGWHHARVADGAARTPVMIAIPPQNFALQAWATAWSLPGTLPLSEYAEGPSLQTFDARFGVTALLGGADAEATYQMDGEGNVANFANVYRSIHALPDPIVTGE